MEGKMIRSSDARQKMCGSQKRHRLDQAVLFPSSASLCDSGSRPHPLGGALHWYKGLAERPLDLRTLGPIQKQSRKAWESEMNIKSVRTALWNFRALKIADPGGDLEKQRFLTRHFLRSSIDFLVAIFGQVRRQTCWSISLDGGSSTSHLRHEAVEADGGQARWF